MTDLRFIKGEEVCQVNLCHRTQRIHKLHHLKVTVRNSLKESYALAEY
jgi:hypothetical protein